MCVTIVGCARAGAGSTAASSSSASAAGAAALRAAGMVAAAEEGAGSSAGRGGRGAVVGDGAQGVSQVFSAEEGREGLLPVAQSARRLGRRAEVARVHEGPPPASNATICMHCLTMRRRRGRAHLARAAAPTAGESGAAPSGARGIQPPAGDMTNRDPPLVRGTYSRARSEAGVPSGSAPGDPASSGVPLTLNLFLQVYTSPSGGGCAYWVDGALARATCK